MTLEPTALAKIVQIIDGIYAGGPAPRVRDRFGRYLRLCQSARLEVQQLLAREGVPVKASGWASGADLGEIALSPLGELRASVPTELWGPVEHAPALCEQLGVVADLTLWTSAQAANRTHVLLSQSAAHVRFQGAYRWFAPGRITPGDARVEQLAAPPSNWRSARFLKATADDFGRPPHSLEYILDYRLGSPGLKVFRVIAVRAIDESLVILPGLHAEMRTLTLSTERVPLLRSLQDGDLALVFTFREPWSEVWHAVEASRATPHDALAHSVTWADFQAEIRDEPPLAFGDIDALRAGLTKARFVLPSTNESLEHANLNRQLLPAARALIRWLRYRI